jgi:hypothetical protein
MLNLVTVRGWKSKEEVMLQSTPIKVIKKHIHDVFYSFSIGQNMLSVGQMMRKGYKLIFL